MISFPRFGCLSLSTGPSVRAISFIAFTSSVTCMLKSGDSIRSHRILPILHHFVTVLLIYRRSEEWNLIPLIESYLNLRAS
jgi:hypothetical protein